MPNPNELLIPPEAPEIPESLKLVRATVVGIVGGKLRVTLDLDGRNADVEHWVGSPIAGSEVLLGLDEDGNEWVVTGPSLILNVMDFGATGDGVTDDTAAIQRAVDWIEASPNQAGTIRFPGGHVFQFSNIVLARYVVLEGDDFNSSVLRRIAGSTGIGITDNGNAVGIGLRNLTIDNATNGTHAVRFGYGGVAQFGSGAFIDKVRIYGAGSGSWALDLQGDGASLADGEVWVLEAPNLLRLQGNAWRVGKVFLVGAEGKALDLNASRCFVDQLHIEPGTVTSPTSAQLVTIGGNANYLDKVFVYQSEDYTTLFQFDAATIENQIGFLTRAISGTPALTNYIEWVGIDTLALNDIGGAGVVPGWSQHSPAACRVVKNAAQSIADSTATAITLNVEDYDYRGMHAANSATVTIVERGIYDCRGRVIFAANATGTRTAKLRKNDGLGGAGDISAITRDVAAADVNPFYITVDDCVELEVGDTITLFASQTQVPGAALNVNALSFLSVNKISDLVSP